MEVSTGRQRSNVPTLRLGAIGCQAIVGWCRRGWSSGEVRSASICSTHTARGSMVLLQPLALFSVDRRPVHLASAEDRRSRGKTREYTPCSAVALMRVRHSITMPRSIHPEGGQFLWSVLGGLYAVSIEATGQVADVVLRARLPKGLFGGGTVRRPPTETETTRAWRKRTGRALTRPTTSSFADCLRERGRTARRSPFLRSHTGKSRPRTGPSS